MRNKLFTAAVNKQLVNQYKYGSDLSKQKVVTKIFNPYGEGRWYLLNSDPNDPDYIWAIVTMYGNVEIGSVSRRELENIRLTPLRLPLERDIYFDAINAEEVFEGLIAGKFYAKGGELDINKYAGAGMFAKGGEVEKDWYDIRSYSIAEHGEDDAKKMAEKYIDEHIKYWKGQVTADELKIRKSPFGGQDFKGEYVVMRLFPKFAKGGVVEYIHKGNDRNNLYYKRFNGAIGSFAWRHEKRYNEGIIYPLDDFDMEYYSHLKLKPNEVILRYRTDRMIGDVKYLVKFNLEKSLVYFMDSDRMSDDDDKNIIFQGRGIPMEYMVLDWDKLYPSQQMNVNYAKGGEMAEGGLVKGLSVDEFAYLYIKRALISAYRESYLRPIGLWNTAKAKEVERSLTSKGLLNSGGAITTKGKELAKEIDTELEKVFSGGYIGSMTENRVSKYESVKAKFNN